MKCPRCGLAELNSGECPICHYEDKPRFNLPHVRKRLEGHWEKDNALQTLWALNLEFYARTRAIIFIFGVMFLGIALANMLETMPLVTIGFALYFGAMAFYEVFRLQKKKKEAKR